MQPSVIKRPRPQKTTVSPLRGRKGVELADLTSDGLYLPIIVDNEATRGHSCWFHGHVCAAGNFRLWWPSRDPCAAWENATRRVQLADQHPMILLSQIGLVEAAEVPGRRIDPGPCLVVSILMTRQDIRKVLLGRKQVGKILIGNTLVDQGPPLNSNYINIAPTFRCSGTGYSQGFSVAVHEHGHHEAWITILFSVYLREACCSNRHSLVPEKSYICI